jgi:hypothetical protein
LSKDELADVKTTAYAFVKAFHTHGAGDAHPLQAEMNALPYTGGPGRALLEEDLARYETGEDSSSDRFWREDVDASVRYIVKIDEYRVIDWDSVKRFAVVDVVYWNPRADYPSGQWPSFVRPTGVRLVLAEDGGTGDWLVNQWVPDVVPGWD